MVNLENFETRELEYNRVEVLIGGVWIPIETIYEIAFDIEEAEKLESHTDIPTTG